MPSRVLAVPEHTSDHNLVHPVDHGRGGTSPAQPVADVDHGGKTGTLPTEIAGHHYPQQALRASRSECLFGKARVAINGPGVLFCDCRYDFRASLEAC